MTTLTPDLLLQAYAAGLFPMADARAGGGLAWYDPDPRGVLPLDRVHVPRRLRRTIRQGLYRVTFNQDFAGVIRACATARAETWINGEIEELYTRLHVLGHAHSAEAWDAQGHLAGGLYGVSLGAAFFGESMFSTARDASKVALVHLCARLWARGCLLLDTQFTNDHIAQFGVVEISRAAYRRRLAAALKAGDQSFFAPSSGVATAVSPSSSSKLGVALSSSGETCRSSCAGAGTAESGAGTVAGVAGAGEGSAFCGAAGVSGAASLENFSDPAEVASFLQAISQTS